MPQRVEVAIVGAGVTGLAAALSLVERGCSVTLFEAGPIGLSGSARNLGLAYPGLNEHYWSVSESLGSEATTPWWQLSRLGLERLEQWLSPVSEARLERGAVMMLAANEAEMEELTHSARPLMDLGFEPRLMGAGAASNYVPVGECEGACYLPQALTFSPSPAMSGLAQRFQELGGTLLANTSVAFVELGSPSVVSFPEGQWEAEMVVLTAGHRSLSLVGREKERLFPLRGQAFLTEPVREGPRSSVVGVVSNRGHEMYRATPQGAMVVSGLNPGASQKEKTDSAEVDVEFQIHLEQVAAKRLPEVGLVDVDQRWGVVHTYSIDGLPLIGTLPGSATAFIAAGFSNRSWSLGVAAGETLARMICDDQPFVLPASASPRRFL